MNFVELFLTTLYYLIPAAIIFIIAFVLQRIFRKKK